MVSASIIRLDPYIDYPYFNPFGTVPIHLRRI
jgi:hypothetical protein